MRAFADEPFMTWVAGGDREHLVHFVRIALRRLTVPNGEVLVDPELTTAALVLPAGALDSGPLDQLRQLPDLVRASRLRRLPTVLRGLVRLEAAHPEEPHDTLLTLGVDPAHQGRGRGGAMLRALQLPRRVQRLGPAPQSVPEHALCPTGSIFALPLLSRRRRKLAHAVLLE